MHQLSFRFLAEAAREDLQRSLRRALEAIQYLALREETSLVLSRNELCFLHNELFQCLEELNNYKETCYGKTNGTSSET